MEANEFIPKCKQLVANYVNGHATDFREIKPEEVYVVWKCKVLQNAKALLSTDLPDGMYYEVTLNGDKDEIYFDAYKKFQNIKVEV
jgi:hypothetical protein